jgi:hypothetical protein
MGDASVTSESSVPALAVAAEILCAGGGSIAGRIFVPAVSARHEGPMWAEEWLNDPAPFFPFLQNDQARPVLINKREVLVVTLAATVDHHDGHLAAGPLPRVALECEGRRVTGEILIAPALQGQRLIDCLNGADAFLTLREGDRHHLVQKQRIARVIDLREA